MHFPFNSTSMKAHSFDVLDATHQSVCSTAVAASGFKEVVTTRRIEQSVLNVQ